MRAGLRGVGSTKTEAEPAARGFQCVARRGPHPDAGTALLIGGKVAARGSPTRRLRLDLPGEVHEGLEQRGSAQAKPENSPSPAKSHLYGVWEV
jgi:hypothetical protein